MGKYHEPKRVTCLEYGEIARFILQHKLPVEKFITHRFPLAEAKEAFRLFDERKTLKVVFTWRK
jgi:propanol-preferring alcohol dehydrogenase